MEGNISKTQGYMSYLTKGRVCFCMRISFRGALFSLLIEINKRESKVTFLTLKGKVTFFKMMICFSVQVKTKAKHFNDSINVNDSKTEHFQTFV